LEAFAQLTPLLKTSSPSPCWKLALAANGCIGPAATAGRRMLARNWYCANGGLPELRNTLGDFDHLTKRILLPKTLEMIRGKVS
jgi:hypothetical protein